MLLVDHLYVCVSQERRETDALRALGLHSDFSRVHGGQGTANDLLLFPGNYFELLFCRDQREAEANPLQLHRRFDWARTGASPFGVALRGARGQLRGHDWVPYRLVGMNAPLHVLAQTLEDDRLPMVFCLESEALEEGGPRGWGLDGTHFAHPCGATGLSDTRLEGPGYARLSGWGLPDVLEFGEADTPHMSLGLEDASFGNHRVGPLLSLA